MRTNAAYLNGQSLADAHPAILVQRITENAVKGAVRAFARPGGYGSHLSAQTYESREIVVEFAIRERLDYTIRAAALDAAAAWAADGGWLTTGQRPDQRILVACTSLPTLGAPRDWTRNIPITLTAYAWPWWEDALPLRAEGVNGTGGTITLHVPGTRPTRLEAEITPGGSLSSASLTVDGGAAISLSGLAISNSETLRLSYENERRVLTIGTASAGKLSCRSAASADDLWLTPGTHEVAWTASAASDVVLIVRGNYT